MRILPAYIFILYTSSLNAQNRLVIDSLTKVLISSKTDSTKTILLFQIGRDFWFSRNFSDAGFYLNKSVDLGEKCGYLKYQADAYNLLANTHLKQEKFELAFICLEKALNQKDERFIPLIHETYSKLYFQLGDYPSSLKHAYQSAAGYEKSTDPKFNMQAVYPYLMVGDIFTKLGQVERGLSYYQKAFDKARTSGRSAYIKTPIQRIANYHLSKNEFNRAIHLYDTIIALDLKGAPNLEPTMYSYEGLGNIAMKQQKFKKAIEHYRMALHYALEKNIVSCIENFSTRLGEAFLALQQKDSARYYLQRSIKLSTTSKSYSNLSAAYLHLSSLQQQQKEYAQALVSFQLHKNYNDSILNVEKIKVVNHLEILHRTKEKENEILRLQKVEQEKDFIIKTRNGYIIFGILLILSMSIILLLLRRNYLNKQYIQEEKVKQMEQQQQVVSLQSMINGQETERARIAKDLHDGLGGLFSTIKMYFSTLEHENQDLKTNELFQKSNCLINTASVELRRVAHNMMPEVLMILGLINAVKDLCDNISAGKLLKVSLEVHGIDNRLNTNTEVMLYRIIQELLNNILKHAQATEAIIQFIKDDIRLSVIVEDNGQGFNMQETDGKIHTGLSTIKSRVTYLNGALTIDSHAGMGTTVMMDFLINEI